MHVYTQEERRDDKGEKKIWSSKASRTEGPAEMGPPSSARAIAALVFPACGHGVQRVSSQGGAQETIGDAHCLTCVGFPF